MRKVWLVLVLACVLLSGCTTMVSKGTGVCPSWAGYDSSVCDIKLFKNRLPPDKFDLSFYEKVRIYVTGGEILIDEANNISVRDDNGKIIDHKSQRIPAGAYVIERIDKKSPGSFVAINPHVGHGDPVNIIGEFVKKAE